MRVAVKMLLEWSFMHVYCTYSVFNDKLGKVLLSILHQSRINSANCCSRQLIFQQVQIVSNYYYFYLSRKGNFLYLSHGTPDGIWR